MALYDLTERDFGSDRFSFIENCLGIALWHKAFTEVLEQPEQRLSWDDINNPLYLFRATAESEYGRSAHRRPMVFVSHSHKDAGMAAALATQIDMQRKDYDVWLDNWDPALARINQSRAPQRRKALLIALAVEMGLLNSTHLVALCTDRSVGSNWIPYEYGRVKPKTVFSLRTAALLPTGHSPSYEPEYLDLGEKFAADDEVIRWL